VNICMIGAGYVGLVSAVCFSEFGWSVNCVDNDPSKIERLNKGEVPIYEPGLEEMLHRNSANGRIKFTTDLGAALRGAQLIFLAVGTPMRRGDGYADLSYIYQAVEDIAPHLDEFVVITTKSTVPVGTSREIERRIRALRPDADFAVCSNPEFLREGSAIRDFTHPDRVLVGIDEDNKRARDVMERAYEPLRLRDAPLMFCSRESAELAKYAANSFLALKISFINEMADLCESVGANVQEVATAIGSDARIGDRFLHPGPGYGGSCFPKDVSALIRTAREARAPLTIIEQVEKVNTERKIAMAQRIERALGGSVRGKTIGVLGVTFKPNTDDMRDAPSLVILPLLMERGATLKVFDPQGRHQAESLLPGVKWCANALAAVEEADACVVLTEWNEFRALPMHKMKRLMKGDVMVDLRNIFRPQHAAEHGFKYTDIGRIGDGTSPHANGNGNGKLS
jgi:UDPglucose 6-dehydrogenase